MVDFKENFQAEMYSWSDAHAVYSWEVKGHLQGTYMYIIIKHG